MAFLSAAVLLVSCAPASTSPSTQPAAAQGHVIKHAMGETLVPPNPQRIVVLDTGLLDHVINLGVTPIGATEPVAGAGFVSYLNLDPKKITNLGFVRQPDIERIAALKPDLILGSKQYHEAIYDQLTHIAPTLFVEIAGQYWKENLQLIADALGKTSEADAVRRDYDARVADFKTKMVDRLAQLKISYIRAALDKMYIYHNTSFAGMVLKDVGIQRPPAQDLASPPAFAEAVSKERLKDLDGDVIFVSTYGANGPDTLSSFTGDALWNQLGAVRQGRVYQVDDEIWAVGIGYRAAGRIIDDLLKYLVPLGQ
jgi:iron complex transport system substrate-binding protein